MLRILDKIPLKGFYYSSLIVNFVVIVFGLLVQKLLPPEIPLFYGLPRGEMQLTRPLGILIPSAFALVLSTSNIFLTTIIKDDFTKSILIVSGFVITLFAAITSVKIIFLIGNI